jgi:putative hemolysin
MTLLDGLMSYYLLADTPQVNTLLIIGLLVLLCLSFVISGAEVALFSLSHKDVNMLKTKQHPAARRVIHLLDEPKPLYASILIASTFINICIIIIANNLLLQYVFGWNVNILSILARLSIIGFVLVFVGKVFPKVWATQNSLRFAFGSAFIIEGLHFILKGISRRLVGVADGIGKNLGADQSEASSLEELDRAIENSGNEEGKNILKSVIKFPNITVRQIMKSRLDVTGVDYKTGFAELVKTIEEHHYSRLPVYRTTLDEVTGILNTKDILPHLHEAADYDWHHLIRQPYFVPETKLIKDLLAEFQLKRIHFAIVVDEFGGTSGIVTMEDVLEEIVGDINDEFDEDENRNRRIDDLNFIFEGKTMIHDACKMMNIPTSTFDTVKNDSETIAGLVFECAGHFPAVNDVIPIGEFDFTILEADKSRLLQIKVTLKPQL